MITYIPEFTELILTSGAESYDFYETIDIVSFSFRSKYQLTENTSILNDISYYIIREKEYLNKVNISSLTSNRFETSIGMRYDNFENYINPSFEIHFEHPNAISINASGRIIKDPIIHSIGLNYSWDFLEKSQQVSLIQGLGFIVNDTISLGMSLTRIFPGKLRPYINTFSFSINYGLNPENDKTFALNNTFRLKNDVLRSNLGIVYSF